MLGAPAIIVSEGGVGRPIDEIVLNAALFERQGVHVGGAIVNKVNLAARPDLGRVLEKGLERFGIPLLGVLPYRPILSNPTLAMVLEGVRGETIHPGPDLDQVIGGVAIGAMEPAHMLERVGPQTLVIVPGDREDVILAITTTHDTGPSSEGTALGLVLTGGYRPRQAVLDAIRRADLFATLVGADTYAVASDVHDLLVKTHPSDHGKITEIKDLVWEHLSADTYHVASAVHDLLVKTHASDTEKIELIKRVVAEHIDVDRVLEVAARRCSSGPRHRHHRSQAGGVAASARSASGRPGSA